MDLIQSNIEFVCVLTLVVLQHSWDYIAFTHEFIELEMNLIMLHSFMFEHNLVKKDSLY